MDLYLIVVRAHVLHVKMDYWHVFTRWCSRFSFLFVLFFSTSGVHLCIGNNMGVMSELNCSFCVCACAVQMIMVVLSRVQYFQDLEVVAVYLLFLFCLLLVW